MANKSALLKSVSVTRFVCDPKNPKTDVNGEKIALVVLDQQAGVLRRVRIITRIDARVKPDIEVRE